MLALIIFFLVEIRASCDLFNVDCQTAGALLSLDSSCYASKNETEATVDSNLTDIYLLATSDSNGSVSSNCALANQQLLEYSHCFAANAASDGSVSNYTANVVKSTNVQNDENVFVGLVEEIFCEPSIDIETDKTALLNSALSSFGKRSTTAETPEIKISGGEKLGAYVAVSIDAAEDNWYSKEFLDCNVTTGDLTVKILINGEVTTDGEKLRAEIVSASSFRFVRFSTRVNIMTAFDVQCSIYWRAKTTEAQPTTTTTATTITTTTLTLIGDVPFAPADGHLIATIDSAAYSSFQVDIFCASGSLPLDDWKAILHVTSGTYWGNLGSRAFAFWRYDNNDSIYIAEPAGGTHFASHTCVANTYSTYKMIVSPDESDNSKSVVELIIDGVLVSQRTSDKDQLIGDGTQLQVWASNDWGDLWGDDGMASTYLIKNLIYTPVR